MSHRDIAAVFATRFDRSLCLCRMNHQHQALVEFPFDGSGLLSQNHCVLHFCNASMRRNQSVNGYTHFASSLVYPECSSPWGACVLLLVGWGLCVAGSLPDASRFKHAILRQSLIPKRSPKHRLQLSSHSFWERLIFFQFGLSVFPL